MITHTSSHTKQTYTPIFTLIVTVPHIIHFHVHTLKDTCVSTFLPFRTLRLTATHTNMCRYHIPTQLCIHTLKYTHTQEYVPTRPHTHFLAMTLSITDPWALTDTCTSKRVHTHTHTHTHRVKRKPPADCLLSHHNEVSPSGFSSCLSLSASLVP